jgi:hypothetical protein
MNGILFEVSNIVRWANAGGGYVYDATFATDSNVGGYPKGARVLRTDGQGYWLNTVDGNTHDPETAGAASAGWMPDYSTGASVVSVTSTNVTLTQLQYGKPCIVVSGSMTANLNLIFPSIVYQWLIINNTTGSHTLTCKTASGTGVALANGDIKPVICDGTDIVTITPSSGGGGGGGGGQLIGVQIFDTPGVTTYTPSVGCNTIFVEIQGGGGAGGNAIGTAGSTTSIALSAGGSAGNYCHGYLQAPLAGSYPVTVGFSGIAGSRNPTGSRFGSYFAQEGVNADPAGAVPAPYMVVNLPPQPDPIVPGTHAQFFSFYSDDPSVGHAIILGITANAAGVSGKGGASKFGPGAMPRVDYGSGVANLYHGNPARNYGSGGGGAIVMNANFTGIGGAGAGGVVAVWEYT